MLLHIITEKLCNYSNAWNSSSGLSSADNHMIYKECFWCSGLYHTSQQITWQSKTDSMLASVWGEWGCFCHNIKNEYTFLVSTETLFSVSKNKIHKNNNIFSLRKKTTTLFSISNHQLSIPKMLCITSAWH